MKACPHIYGYNASTLECAAALNIFQRQSKIFARIQILEIQLIQDRSPTSSYPTGNSRSALASDQYFASVSIQWLTLQHNTF